jgi:hypothetical protein
LSFFPSFFDFPTISICLFSRTQDTRWNHIVITIVRKGHTDAWLRYDWISCHISLPPHHHARAHTHTYSLSYATSCFEHWAIACGTCSESMWALNHVIYGFGPTLFEGWKVNRTWSWLPGSGFRSDCRVRFRLRSFGLWRQIVLW